MSNIKKHFGGVYALKGVDFNLKRGQVHALLGENGAGKSTLIKILSGAYILDDGVIKVGDKEYRMLAPGQAKALGIATIYQETSLFSHLSVLENLFIGRQPRTRLGLINWRKMRAEAERILYQLGVHLNLNARLQDIGKALAQLVEIAKALLQHARILIMDEPTAALSAGEVEHLFKIITGLKQQGTAIIFISHHLEEIFRIADRVTILRDGEVVGSDLTAHIEQTWVVQKMVGRQPSQRHTRRFRKLGKPLLQIDGLSNPGVFEKITLTVHEGEIVALAGLVGAGRSDVVRAIMGIDPYQSGTLTLNGKIFTPTPWGAIAEGLGLVPENRAKEGLILDLSARVNMTLSVFRRLSRRGVLNSTSEQGVVDHLFQDLQIRPADQQLPASSFSGGNQQKIVLAKLLAIAPKVLLMDEPTQGVDVGAKAEVHQIMDTLVNQGCGILLVSSDMPEVLGMADRVLVMYNGEVVT
jgi:ABC-type sugar transport system ATPase subunit